MVVPAVMPMAVPGRTMAAAASAIARFCWVSRCDFTSKPGLVGAALLERRRPAVDLLDETGGGEHVEVAPDRHVGHLQPSREVADPDRAALTNLRQDQVLALASQDARGAGRRRRAVSPWWCTSVGCRTQRVQVNRIERKPTAVWAE